MLTAVASRPPPACAVPARPGTENAPPYLNFFLDRYRDAYRAELDHLVTCVEQGRPPSPGFADGRAALVLADAANESLKTGRAVQVDAAHGTP